jgi:hypothetical protein
MGTVEGVLAVADGAVDQKTYIRILEQSSTDDSSVSQDLSGEVRPETVPMGCAQPMMTLNDL